MVDQAVLDKLEAGYAKLAASDSKSLLKKFLTKEVFDNLKTKKTPSFGSTLLDVIQSGKLKNHYSEWISFLYNGFVSSGWRLWQIRIPRISNKSVDNVASIKYLLRPLADRNNMQKKFYSGLG